MRGGHGDLTWWRWLNMSRIDAIIADYWHWGTWGTDQDWHAGRRDLYGRMLLLLMMRITRLRRHLALDGIWYD